MNSKTAFYFFRGLGITAILFFFVTWLIGALIFIEGIFSNLDAVLDLIFDGWAPAGIRAASIALGIPASTSAWTMWAHRTADHWGKAN